MKKTNRLVVLGLSSLLIAIGFAASAELGDDGCVEACEEAHARCIDICGSHDNPIECEEDCDEAAEDCTRQCR